MILRELLGEHTRHLQGVRTTGRNANSQELQGTHEKTVKRFLWNF